MKSLPTIAAPIAAVVAVLLAGPAAAQLSQGKGPVDIASDQLETANNECVSTWRGNVEALQDNARLRTDLLKMYFQKGARPGSAGGGNCGDLIRMEAQGAVYYVTPQQRVHGDNALYEATTDTLTVTGDVVAAQGQNVLRGERMVINTKTGEGHMVGSAQGRNKPNRVRGVFYPQQSSKPQQPAQAGQRR
ncbi:LptA/OstA family protein [Phenylobacterium soli]|uniref:Organic solvent tolerance protein OstA n=1 Tax=Phenylobacterium soli TaxID=2170551 RepID=A0A328AKL7_9CAUL|nr:LptA/OstA family protein [Phenylobacterium soli]RAK53418.1 organic solvent tolerance protein OstA [Phenylobacterium soli]